MKIFYAIAIFLFLNMNAFSQEVLFEKEIPLSFSIFKDKREVFPAVNNKTKEVAFFLFDNKEIKGVKFNKNYELTSEFVMNKPKNKFSTLLGHYITNEKYYLFFTDDKSKKFLVASINLSNKVQSTREFHVEDKEEKFLEAISYNDAFYVLTMKKKSSILKIYVFKGDKPSEVKELDFSAYTFSEYPLYDNLFYSLFGQSGNSFGLSSRTHIMDGRDLNPLGLATKECKIYYVDDMLYITLDDKPENTKILSISLNDFSSDVRFYNQPNIEKEELYVPKSNSYLLKDYLYQIKANSNELCLQVTNIKNNTIHKEYRVKKDEEISFKNTPIELQKKEVFGFTKSERELDKTNKLLRKIAHNNIGITARLTEENIIELTIGTSQPITSGGGFGMMPGVGLSMGSANIGGMSFSIGMFYNPTMYGYSTYIGTKTVDFKTLLDGVEFNHIPDKEVSKNIYDIIDTYSKENFGDNTALETVFRVDDYYVFGCYERSEEKYYLVKFQDKTNTN